MSKATHKERHCVRPSESQEMDVDTSTEEKVNAPDGIFIYSRCTSNVRAKKLAKALWQQAKIRPPPVQYSGVQHGLASIVVASTTYLEMTAKQRRKVSCNGMSADDIQKRLPVLERLNAAAETHHKLQSLVKTDLNLYMLRFDETKEPAQFSDAFFASIYMMVSEGGNYQIGNGYSDLLAMHCGQQVTKRYLEIQRINSLDPALPSAVRLSQIINYAATTIKTSLVNTIIRNYQKMVQLHVDVILCFERYGVFGLFGMESDSRTTKSARTAFSKKRYSYAAALLKPSTTLLDFEGTLDETDWELLVHHRDFIRPFTVDKASDGNYGLHVKDKTHLY
ncbi:hypothetical protein EDD86DRAFT_254649 [Gorgonomyces haynaldii]|nr:hypothetical protein EDD86DRAFT_254649 [Gorgonomyces haynaldii]